MIPEAGHFALVLAFILALVQAGPPLWGAWRGNGRLMALAGPAALGQFLFIGLAFAALTHGFVVSDFSLSVVEASSHSAKPLIYRITGVWGNHEGSMLLWVLILALFGACIAAFARGLPATMRARTLAVQGMTGAGFLAFILFTSNPFLRLDPAPVDGSGLNPLLQDIGLVLHPPFLYLGYVGFSTAFSFAVAGLLEGRVDTAWARHARPWTLAAWSALTIGIGLGSWWAYYELGWGGWWFWDPVENASFMPWLAGTALLHSIIVVGKREALRAWTVLLAILTFSLSLIGTFLVRSGVLTSVHSFAQDPERGLFILMLLSVAIGGSLLLFAIRAPALRTSTGFALVSREGALLLNNLLLASACATVFLGTLYPLFLDALTGDRISVGPPYFNATFVPIVIPLILLMAAGPLLGWKRADLPRTLRRLWPAGLAALLAFVASLVVADGIGPALGMALAGWLFAGVLVELAGRVALFRVSLADSLSRTAGLPATAWGMTMAHAGVAVAVAGITASSAWQTETIQVMRPGDSVDVAGYSFLFEAVEENLAGPNWTATRATIRVSRDGRPVAVLTPEKRFYPVRGMPTTEAAIHTTWLADLYAVISEPDGAGGWSTRFYYNPLVPWIWAGILLTGLGGLVSLADRRHRARAGQRRRATAGATTAGAA